MASRPSSFLEGVPLRALALPPAHGIVAKGLALGRGNPALEVVLAQSSAAPKPDDVRQLWRSRHAGRAAPVLVAVLHDTRATVCGPLGDPPQVYPTVDESQADRILREALNAPDRHAAIRLLRDVLQTVAGELPGIRNEGLLATHELRVGVKKRADYPAATENAKRILHRQDKDLLESLGYRIERLDNFTSLLRGNDQRRLALAVLLEPHEAPEVQSERFARLSPISYALSVADREGLPFVVVCQGPKIRLYPARVGIGVGQRSRTETFIEAYTTVLRDDDAGYLWMLFSAAALDRGGTLEQLLADSGRFAGDLAADLRERIYDKVIPRLAESMARARNLRRPGQKELRETYDMAMLALFRLLFIAYAEDKDLLPYRWNELYQRRSLKTKARELLEAKLHGVEFGDETTIWQEVQLLFNAVADGSSAWGVPAYNGGLFTADAHMSEAGAELAKTSLPDREFAPVLADLLLAPSPEGLGPIDFRSLGVREFGTVYEGLLESELALAEVDLTVDEQGHYRPAKRGEEPAVRKGQVYLHDRAGTRKATGSFFTKSFAVDYLLDRALEPALADHLERLDTTADESAAAEAFFDFRVADIAMGSGHFLVAAVDRIERGLAGYLARRNLSGVRSELTELRRAATAALGSLAEEIEIEDTQLLRRLVARRCIYGVDLNPIAAQLARLAIWVHTFVPGLPLSFLDHNLVVGNSLIGVADFEEVEQAIRNDDVPLFRADASVLLSAAAKPLHRLAKLADATLADVERAKKLIAELAQAVEPVKVLCDMVTAARFRREPLALDLRVLEQDLQSLFGSRELRRLKKDIDGLAPFHFPIAFPEVFLRLRPGFDVVLGNPPWEKVRTEEHEFWARHFPGLRGLKTADRDRTLASLKTDRPDLIALWDAERDATARLRDAVRELPGMDTGHPDLFRAFIWRFLTISAADKGRLGVVLPGDAFKIKGATRLREIMRRGATTIEIQLLTNKGEWVFNDVDERKLVCLFASARADRESTCAYRIFREVHGTGRWGNQTIEQSIVRPDEWLTQYSPSRVIPTLPSTRSVEIIDQMMHSPSLAAHPTLKLKRVYADFETTRDKVLYVAKKPEDGWPVYKGESFDIWNPDTGTYYAWTSGQVILPRLLDRRLRSPTYSAMPVRWLQSERTHPALHPRIAYRDVTNRTNTRTLIVTLIPPNVVTTQSAPWILWLDANHPAWHEAYLLGVMSTVIADWWIRRFVEGHVDEEAFNCFRVPDPSAETELHTRAATLAGRLGAIDKRFAVWAKAVGVEHGVQDEDEKNDQIAELDALVAHLYGLSEPQLTHIFETFHEGWDFTARLRAVQKHFKAWTKRR
jgi:hypothetical protein